MSRVQRSPVDKSGMTTRSQARDGGEKSSSCDVREDTVTRIGETRVTACTSNQVTEKLSSDNIVNVTQSIRRNLEIESLFADIIRRLEDLDIRTRMAENTSERLADNIRRSGMRLDDVREASFSDDENPYRNNIVGNLKLPRGGWLKDPFENLTFSGRSDNQNPMKFLTRFQRIARYEKISDVDQLHYFGKCMRGAASNWFDVTDPTDISEAFASFQEYYWSDEQQARLREIIYIGKYNRAETRLSMAEYALDLSRQAKNLQPPLTDKEIIRCVRRHFGSQIMREIRPSTVSSMEDFVKLLDEVENDMKRDREERNRRNVTTKLDINDNASNRNRVNFQKFGDQYRNLPANSSSNFSNKYGKSVEYHPNKLVSNLSGNRAQSSVRITELPTEKTSSSFRDVPKRVNEVKNDRSSLSQSNRRVAMIDRDGEMRDLDEVELVSCFPNDNHDSVTEASSDFDDNLNTDFQVNIIRTKDLLADVDEITREDQECATRNLRPYALVKFDTIRVKCLVDTGAQISAITKSFFDKLTKNKISMRVVPIRKFNLVGAFSEKGEPIAKKIFVDFVIGEREFSYGLYVVKNLSYEMVLGLDFLSENNAILHCCEKNFKLGFDVNRGVENVAVNVMSLDKIDPNLEIILRKHGQIFEDNIGRVNNYEHEIRVTSNAPYKCKTYPIADIHRDKVKEHLLELERMNIIERTATQFINPLVVVVKKSGEIRLCLDARELNKRMENDHNQPPTIDEIFKRIGSRKVFSTLDVAKAFWQIPLRKSDRKFTGFRFDNQTYVFKRMPFGLKTAGSSFMRAINKTIGDDCHNFALVYLDDILIASDSLEQHYKHLDLILGRMEEAGFRLNESKCEFLKNEISFLGHTFDQVKVDMNTDTRLAIQNFPKPYNRKTIQSFLGLVNWDRRFIHRLAELTKPLEQLLKKNVKFQWREEHQNAFMSIKEAFRDASCLSIIRSDMKFGIYTDASRSGLGARLYQYHESNPEAKYTVAYASRSLRGAELNYTITELECLAIVWALRKWHLMLLGRHIVIHTDHRALKFLTSCADDSTRIARWIAFLREFDLDIRHNPGNENIVADALSRNNVEAGGVRTRDTIRRIAAIRYPEDEIETSRCVDIVIDAQNTDDTLQQLYIDEPNHYCKRNDLIRIRYNNEDRIVIPDKIRWKLLNYIHDYLLHFGTDKVIDFSKDISR